MASDFQGGGGGMINSVSSGRTATIRDVAGMRSSLVRKSQVRLMTMRENVKAAADKQTKQKEKATANRRARARAYSDLGMKKVRGALGGTYYE